MDSNHPFLYDIDEIEKAIAVADKRLGTSYHKTHQEQRLSDKEYDKERATGAPSGGGRLQTRFVEVEPGRMGKIEGMKSIYDIVDEVKKAANEFYKTNVKMPVGWKPPTSDEEVIQMVISMAESKEFIKEKYPDLYDRGWGLNDYILEYNKRQGNTGLSETDQYSKFFEAVRRWRDNIRKHQKRERVKEEKKEPVREEDALYNIDNWVTTSHDIEKITGYTAPGKVYNKVLEKLFDEKEYRAKIFPKIVERIRGERATEEGKKGRVG
jgi:hypothetical protein